MVILNALAIDKKKAIPFGVSLGAFGVVCNYCTLALFLIVNETKYNEFRTSKMAKYFMVIFIACELLTNPLQPKVK